MAATEVKVSDFGARPNDGKDDAPAFRKAIEACKKAIEANPYYANAYHNLSVAYYYEGKYDLAVEYCNKALALGAAVNPKYLKIIEPYRK